MMLVMEVQSVKTLLARKGLRSQTGEVGALALTYKQNIECTAEEWEQVKVNYTKVLEIRNKHKAMPAPDEAEAFYIAAEQEIQSAPPPIVEEPTRWCPCVIL
jgi:hypothetical protein